MKQSFFKKSVSWFRKSALDERRQIKIEVGDRVTYNSRSGRMSGVIEKIKEDKAHVRCFVLGSIIKQWIDIKNLKKSES